MENTEHILSQVFAASQAVFSQEVGEETLQFIHKDYKEAPRPRAGYETDRPNRVVVKQTVKETDDFIAFVKQYQTPETKLFYTDAKAMVIYNYPTADKADFADSYTTLTLEKTTAFRTFDSVAGGRKLTQKEFIRILKELQSYIVSIDAIELVTLAQNLQGVTKVNSMMTNSSRAIIIDAQVKGGKADNIELPEKLVFSLPIYKNNVSSLTDFEVEIFAEFENDSFGLNLICYRLEEIVEEATRNMMQRICIELDGIPSFRI